MKNCTTLSFELKIDAPRKKVTQNMTIKPIDEDMILLVTLDQTRRGPIKHYKGTQSHKRNEE